MIDLSASNDVIIIFSRIHWGKKFKLFSFWNLIPWFVDKLSTSVIPPNNRLQQLEWYRGNFKVTPAWRCMPTDFLFISSLLQKLHLIQQLRSFLKFPHFQNSKETIAKNISLDSSYTESDVFYVEQSSVEGSPIRNNTPAIFNSTEISGAMEGEVITISSVASPEPRIVTLDSDSNDPTIPYGFRSQQPIVLPSLNTSICRPNPSMCWQRCP